MAVYLGEVTEGVIVWTLQEEGGSCLSGAILMLFYWASRFWWGSAAVRKIIRT